MRMKLPSAVTVALACLMTSGCMKNQKVVRAASLPPAPPSAGAPPIQVPPPSVLAAEVPPEEPIPTQPANQTANDTENTQHTKRPSRKPSAPASPPTANKPATTQMAANAADPETSVIGQLSTGGDSVTSNRRQAVDFLEATEKRVNSLSAQTVQQHQNAVNQVRDFLRKAHEALKSGDVDGANNLTTKAKVLLDDIQS